MGVIDLNEWRRTHQVRSPTADSLPIHSPGAALIAYRDAACAGTLPPPALATYVRLLHPRLYWASVLVAAICLAAPRWTPLAFLVAPLPLLLGPVFVMGAILDSLYAIHLDTAGFVARWAPFALKSFLFLPLLALFLSLIAFPAVSAAIDGLLFLGLPLSTVRRTLSATSLLLGFACYASWLRFLHSLVFSDEGVFRAGRDGLGHQFVSQDGSPISLRSRGGLPQALAYLLALTLADQWAIPALLTGGVAPLAELALIIALRLATAIGLVHLVLILTFAWMVDNSNSPGGNTKSADD